MRVFNRGTLIAFWTKHPDSEQPLKAWHHEAESSTWLTPADVKARYPMADIIPGDRVVFDIKGNTYRIICHISYERHSLFIKFIGTHAEYDKVDAETIDCF